jgi:hypothetical protein
MDGWLASIILRIFVYTWLPCAVFNYGAAFAYFQGEYPISAESCRIFDIAASILMALTGPYGTLAILIAAHPWHGWRVRWDGRRFL